MNEWIPITEYYETTKKNNKSQALWLTPAILATQEAQIRRMEVRSQPGQIVYETLSGKNSHKKELVEWLKV
jgi:hypothetical protein